jgi:hypothetical protein
MQPVYTVLMPKVLKHGKDLATESSQCNRLSERRQLLPMKGHVSLSSLPISSYFGLIMFVTAPGP